VKLLFKTQNRRVVERGGNRRHIWLACGDQQINSK